TTLHARVVVGADGLNSVVARRLGVRTEHAPRRVAYTAHVADVRDVGDAGEMHVGQSGYVGLGPVGGGVTTVALVLPLAAVLAAEVLIPALAATGPVTAAALSTYRRARRHAFLGKWTLERLIGLGVGWPALAERVIARLARRPALADLLVGATGNFVPVRAALRPGVLARLLF